MKSDWTARTAVLICLIVATMTLPVRAQEGGPATAEKGVQEWNQWRGPNRDGNVQANWPSSLDDKHLEKIWSVDMGPSYSGPIVVGDQVFVTETKDKKYEVVTALDRKTGKVLWQQEWEGAMQVPFFAAANGSWIRATPAYDDGHLYVAGIRDVLVCLNAKNGDIVWKIDFPKETGSTVPTFGFVCSPLIDGNNLYIQAGGALCKIDKKTGKLIWRSLDDGGGMNGSAFSSPYLTTIGGKRQLLVQTRTNLVGVDPETGAELWVQPVKSFRGMNILTPTVFEDGVFVSTYGGTTQMLGVSGTSNAYNVTPRWNLPAQGYMTSPVIVNGHAYIHLRNQRFACFDLKNGKETWRSKPYGKYSSLVSNGKQILALDQRGDLMLINANPEEFEVVDTRKVADDSWAHLAVRGDEVFVRDLNKMTAYKWTKAD
ncbi:MAG: PQQ-like beta-propeller repeat protein [Mariniblastus sp.]|nr:PQQ-like beta-propeller repeat protein [Mariniblastus sp.]